MSFPEIVCTLGTSTDDERVLRGMRDAGMGMARINTAYATPEEIARRVDLLRSVAPVPIMLDLKGPQLRLDCTTEKVDPVTGRTATVRCRYPIAGGELIAVGFATGPVRFNHDFEADLVPGDAVTFQNGTIRTIVVDPAEEAVARPEKAALLRVLDPGEGFLAPLMGANVPGKRLHVPRLSARDLEMVDLGVAKRVEAWALSFTRDAEDVRHLQEALVARGERDGAIVPKIEEASGVAALEEIVAAVRALGRPVAVMIGRGDLFVELPRVRLAAVQKDLIRRCRACSATPSIVATGLLLSLQTSAVPARAEVCDVANAVADGADSLLLSDETSNGRDPILAVRTLAEIVREYREYR